MLRGVSFMRRLATRGLLVVLCPPRLLLFRLVCRMRLLSRRRRRLLSRRRRRPHRLVRLQRRRRLLSNLQSLRRRLALPWYHPRRPSMWRLLRSSQILLMVWTLLLINSVANTFNVNSVHTP